LTASTVNGSGNGARSGAHTLQLLAVPVNVLILRALAEGARPRTELQRAAGSPAQTTLRGQLNRLTEIGALERHRRNRFPGVLEFELTAAGRDLLFVLDVLERWLHRAPGGPLELAGNPAKAAIRALAEGWSTSVVRALAAGPRSLTELDGVIGSLTYPSLERRLGAMRLTGQIEAVSGDGRGTPYSVTEWLRRAIAPLTASIRWERAHLAESTRPFGRLDAEAAFLLAMPLLEALPLHPSGTCRLAVELSSERRHSLAGAMVRIQPGKPVSCTTRLPGHPDAWVLGPPGAWLTAIIDGDRDRLELGGDCRLAHSLLEALHRALFCEDVASVDAAA
jgi:DNA-binding HxlR family transcriptional regulator